MTQQPATRGPGAPANACPSNLLLETQVLLELVSGAQVIAAACPSCAHLLAGVLEQKAPLRQPKSVAGAGADAASGPPYLCPSNLLLEAQVRLSNLL